MERNLGMSGDVEQIGVKLRERDAQIVWVADEGGGSD
jgi:hypothetical protein